MNTKDKIKQILEENIGRFVSGEEIAQTIYVTRACVWKNIKALQNEGVEIDAITNRGYRIRSISDIPDVHVIMENLRKENIDMEVTYIPVVKSTNDTLIEMATEGHKERVVIAGMQTGGRGRRGRKFYSPEDTGLYFSILLYPDTKLSKVVNLTAMAAVATAQAIDEVIFEGTDESEIKWVNDIYIDGKKVCGILTEGHTSLEDTTDNYVIVGIGINLYAPVDDFPKDIRNVAGYIINGVKKGDSGSIKNDLLTAIITKLINYYRGDEDCRQKCINTYRAKSILTGSYVKINAFDGNYTYAKVTGISDEYHLEVEYDDGREGELSSGEVSVVKY